MSSRPVSSTITASVLGIILGDTGGNKSIVLAKLVKCYPESSAPSCEPWKVVELSSLFMLLFLVAGCVFGVSAVIRRWIDLKHLLVTVTIALFASLFSILDQIILVPADSAVLPLTQSVYLFGWLLVLWVSAFVLLHSSRSLTNPTPDEVGLRAIRVILVMILVSAIVGLVLRELAKHWWNYLFEDIMQYTTCIEHSYRILSDKARFWVVHPSMFNPICGTLLVVFFYSGWWGRLLRRRSVIIYATCVIVYAGLYGSLFYIDRSWADKLIMSDPTIVWGFFVAFAGFPLATVAMTSMAFHLTRRQKLLNMKLLPVSSGFWLALPIALAVGFGGVAKFGFAPLLEMHGGNASQIWGFVIAHSSNGALLGMTFGVLMLMARYWYRVCQRIGF